MSALLASLRSIDFKSLALAALDIIVVAYILYRLIVLAKGRRAWQILIGIGVFFLLVLLSNWLGLVTLNWLLQSITPLGPVAIVILLYPELREVLERLGRLDFWGAPLSVTRQENITGTIEAIVTAATLLSARKTGALILMARETGLDDVIATGTVLNATVTPELLTTIFYSGTALHDGAVIVRDGFLVAAGCTLPLSDAPNIATNVHMRHRAAMGASESSDAVVVIVSEETGTISIAIGGKLDRGLKPELLREKLLTAFGKGTKKPLPRLSLTRKNKEASSEAPLA